MNIVFVVMLGLAMGSFINATVYRLQKKMDFIKARSICEHCRHVLNWNDLIPVVSWLSLKGRCRYCGNPISPVHLAVETAVAAAFGLSYAHWPLMLASVGDWMLFAVWLAMVTVLAGLFIFDVRTMELPDNLMRILAVLAVTFVIIRLLQSEVPTELLKDSILGFAYGGGIFYLLHVFSNGKWMGGGDVKLGFVMGLVVGAVPAVIALLIAFYSSAIYILPLMMSKKLTRKSRVPFGPFLIVGFFSAFVWSEPLRDLLNRLLGLQ